MTGCPAGRGGGERIGGWGWGLDMYIQEVCEHVFVVVCK